MKFFFLLIIISVHYLVFAAGGTVFAQEQKFYEQEQVRIVNIPKVSNPPKFVDFINGTPREDELVITDFRQSTPGDGELASQETTAYLSYDDKNLYVAFICKDDPTKIRATITRRDAISSDDRVTVSLDTFHDHQHNYWFESNAYGVQQDGTNTNGTDDIKFDTLWYSEGRIVEDGYVVFMTIPFKSLRFPKAPEQSWGLMLSRAIQRYNEWSNWPYRTWRLMPSWQGQFGDLTGLRDISPGLNMQFIPYIGLSFASYLTDESRSQASGLQYDDQNEFRGGLDAKVVLHDSLTLDMTLNPDFSQVESDSPQVTINQRYEVFFPEKRPFFMENAYYFEMPETLFSSRRMVDPQFGGRLTGKLGRWGIGVLAGDDRAPGEIAPKDSDYYGEHAFIGVLRLYRELGKESRIGGLFTSRNFGGSYNHVLSMDTDLKLTQNLTLTGQCMGNWSRHLDGENKNGIAGYLRLAQSGRNFTANAYYRDRSPDFETDLGYITRVNMREIGGSVGYTWRPQKGTIISYGPSFTGNVIYDYDGTLTDWAASLSFTVDLPRYTSFSLLHKQGYERYADMDFHGNGSRISISSELLKWLRLSSNAEYGDRIYYAGERSFLAKSVNTSFTLNFIPVPQLQIGGTYLYTWLATSLHETIVNNHIFRIGANYQITRELSLRAIVDYNAVLPNDTLVNMEVNKKLGLNFLITYMLHPGTALYIGYIDNYENLTFDPAVSPFVQRGDDPNTYIGRQFYVKLSYLLRI